MILSVLPESAIANSKALTAAELDLIAAQTGLKQSSPNNVSTFKFEKTWPD
jgi:hypothetical protein